jgi:hypothetical protein
MTDQNNQEYYARRAAIAKELADAAAEPAVSSIHAQMAAAYQELANGRRSKLRMSF